MNALLLEVAHARVVLPMYIQLRTLPLPVSQHVLTKAPIIILMAQSASNAIHFAMDAQGLAALNALPAPLENTPSKEHPPVLPLVLIMEPITF